MLIFIVISINMNAEESSSAFTKITQPTEEIVAELRHARIMGHILRNAGMSHKTEQIELQYTDAVLSNVVTKRLIYVYIRCTWYKTG